MTAYSSDLNKTRKWATQSSPVDKLILKEVSAVDAKTVWAVGDNGTILKTTDGGASKWKQQASPTSMDLLAVCAVDENTAWAVGKGGAIIKIEDGANCSAENSGTGKDLNGVSTVDSENAWAVGEDGTIVYHVLQPKIIDCKPDSSYQGVSFKVEITGSNTHFEEGESTVDMGSGITVNSVDVVSHTEVNADVTIADNARVGARSVRVTTAVEVPEALKGGFTVLEKPKNPPRIDGLHPSHGTTGTKVTLSVEHLGDTRRDSCVMFNKRVEVIDYVSWAEGKIVCKVPSGAETVPVYVPTYTDSNKDHIFTVDEPHSPRITDVSPNQAKQGQSNYQVEITGEYTHFSAGSTAQVHATRRYNGDQHRRHRLHPRHRCH